MTLMTIRFPAKDEVRAWYAAKVAARPPRIISDYDVWYLR